MILFFWYFLEIVLRLTYPVLVTRLHPQSPRRSPLLSLVILTRDQGCRCGHSGGGSGPWQGGAGRSWTAASWLVEIVNTVLWLVNKYCVPAGLLMTSCWSSVVLAAFSCCCFFLTNCSADLRSSKVTPWVDLLVSLTRLACAFLWISCSSSRTGGTNDLKKTGMKSLIITKTNQREDKVTTKSVQWNKTNFINCPGLSAHKNQRNQDQGVQFSRGSTSSKTRWTDLSVQGLDCWPLINPLTTSTTSFLMLNGLKHNNSVSSVNSSKIKILSGCWKEKHSEQAATHLKNVLNMLVIPCCWGPTPFSGDNGEAWREELLETSSEPELGEEMSLDLTERLEMKQD